MVRTNVTKQAGLGEPLSQFETPKRPEIKRLPPYDDSEIGPQTTVKALGKGFGKDGSPLVADLIRLREDESKLVQESANEKLGRKPNFRPLWRLKRPNLRNGLNAWIP